MWRPDANVSRSNVQHGLHHLLAIRLVPAVLLLGTVRTRRPELKEKLPWPPRGAASLWCLARDCRGACLRLTWPVEPPHEITQPPVCQHPQSARRQLVRWLTWGSTHGPIVAPLSHRGGDSRPSRPDRARRDTIRACDRGGGGTSQLPGTQPRCRPKRLAEANLAAGRFPLKRVPGRGQFPPQLADPAR